MPAPARLDMGAHLATLLPLYHGLAARRPRAAPAPLDERALVQREHAFQLREAALHELLRSEGWEDVIARLQGENDELRRRAGG